VITIIYLFYFDLGTAPFIPEGYVTKERREKETSSRPSAGELQPSAPSVALCAGAPLTGTGRRWEQKKERGG